MFQHFVLFLGGQIEWPHCRVFPPQGAEVAGQDPITRGEQY